MLFTGLNSKRRNINKSRWLQIEDALRLQRLFVMQTKLTHVLKNDSARHMHKEKVRISSPRFNFECPSLRENDVAFPLKNGYHPAQTDDTCNSVKGYMHM